MFFAQWKASLWAPWVALSIKPNIKGQDGISPWELGITTATKHLWRYCFVCGSKCRHDSADSDKHSRGIWPHMFTSMTHASQLAANQCSDGFSYCYWINEEVADFEQHELISVHWCSAQIKMRRRSSTHFPRSLPLEYYPSAIHATCIPHKRLPFFLEVSLPISVCASFADQCILFPQKTPLYF